MPPECDAPNATSNAARERFDDTGLILAAAGASRRFGGEQNKLLQPLDGVPLVCHSLRTFLPLLDPEAVVVMVPAELTTEFRHALGQGGIPDTVRIMSGGEERQETIYRGLCALEDRVTVVATQDGARPYTPQSLFAACIASARSRGSGVAARRVTDTIKVADADGRVVSTPDRATLWAAETPQIFDYSKIRAAYERLFASGGRVTDDAQALERAGEPVYLVAHEGRNPKITYPSDLDA